MACMTTVCTCVCVRVEANSHSVHAETKLGAGVRRGVHAHIGAPARPFFYGTQPWWEPPSPGAVSTRPLPLVNEVWLGGKGGMTWRSCRATHSSARRSTRRNVAKRLAFRLALAGGGNGALGRLTMLVAMTLLPCCGSLRRRPRNDTIDITRNLFSSALRASGRLAVAPRPWVLAHGPLSSP